MSYKGKVFILNKPFEGSYTDNEGNVAHEIINYFRADNGNIYIYNNPLGHCPKNIYADGTHDYKVEYMFLAKKAIMNKKGDPKWSEFELTHLIKIKNCLHHESAHDIEKNKNKLKDAQGVVKDVIDSKGITYGSKTIYEIFGPDDVSLYVTFEAEKSMRLKALLRSKRQAIDSKEIKGMFFRIPCQLHLTH